MTEPTGVVVFVDKGDPDKRIRRQWAENLARHMDQARLWIGEPMTRKELRRQLEARGVEVSEQAIGAWLRGETAPRPHVMAHIAGIFQVPVHSIFGIEAVRGAA